MKAFYQIFGLLAFLVSLTMGFTHKKPGDILYAIGSIEGLPVSLQRAFAPGKAFEPLSDPKPGEWLAEHAEPGQTFDQFIRCAPNKPNAQRNRIYLQPLGVFPEGLSPSLEKLRAFTAAYFALEVEVLDPLLIDTGNIRSRRNPYTGNQQMLTTDILSLLKKRLPKDAFCVLSITMEDLYPDPSWNFVFGQASFRDRVGVFSFVRYDPAFYGQDRENNYQEKLLRRSFKVLAHETGHMFLMGHCVFFKCVMNGSNHLQESDERPLHLCPVCLRKLHSGIGFHVVDRYQNLLGFYNKIGFSQEVEWVSNRLELICK